MNQTDIKEEKSAPTKDFYDLFQYLYDHFNKSLFYGDLPNCMIVITRKRKTYGYFSPERWQNNNTIKSHEIAINPMYFNDHPLVEILKTLVHEMCHLWQEVYGEPSAKTYHNKEWGNKMESIGLMPSNTGEQGGKKTGQQMSEYVIENGLFIQYAKNIEDDDVFKTLWFDRMKYAPDENSEGADFESMTLNMEDYDANDDDSEEEEEEEEEIVKYEDRSPNLNSIVEIKEPIIQNNTNNRYKTKYSCPDCKTNVWGKPNLNLICGDCSLEFNQVSEQAQSE